MECVLLGSGGMMPMPYRFLTSLAVRLQGQLYIVDAGEGCQMSLKKTKLGIKTLRVLAISHLHGDHCLGAPGLLMMRAQVPDPDHSSLFSYLLSGSSSGGQTFFSTAHGSGRTMSRAKARKIWRGQKLQQEMEERGVYVRTASRPGLAEEAGGLTRTLMMSFWLRSWRG
jgi:ribonuclease BN (tRNA processing enzyme)